jgi:hypothetical protein
VLSREGGGLPFVHDGRPDAMWKFIKSVDAFDLALAGVIVAMAGCFAWALL